MTLGADPYRTLGLARGASLDEVKRAYRKLAKVNHPDAAGEAALPRFLAIQAAYEQLLGGSAGSVTGRRPAGSRAPWEADPTRGDATRRAYGSRGRGAPPGTPPRTGERPPTPPGAAGANGRARTDPAGAAGSAGGPWAGAAPGGPAADAASGAAPGPGAGPTEGSSWSSRRRTSGSASGQAGARPAPGPDRTSHSRTRSRGDADKPPNKATLGSTSYDGAEGPFEPDWGGASWYGTTSGTYWTLNPKEYADPRKHGPEYQARARRAARSREGANGANAANVGAGAGAPQEPAMAAETSGPAGSASAPPPGRASGGATTGGPTAGPNPGPTAGPTRGPNPGPTHTTSSWWDSTAGPADDPADLRAANDRARPSRAPDRSPADEPPPDLGRAFADIARALTDVDYGGWRGRLVRALIGWLPIALGLGWLVGELTGCGRFAATCDGSADPIALSLQLAVLAVLLLVPWLASLTTMAALSVLGTSLIAALILSATGAAADGEARRAALGVVLLFAWLVGLAAAIWRRVREVPSPTRPVS